MYQSCPGGASVRQSHFYHKNFIKAHFCCKNEIIAAADKMRKFKNMLDNIKNNAILNNIGCESLMSRAAACHRQGGKLQNLFFAGSFYIEPAGRYICTGVTLDTSLTPAGSFFVPDVRVGGKILAKNLYQEKVCYDKR